MRDPFPPADLPGDEDDPASNGDYQQDAMWPHDYGGHNEEIIRIEYEKKVPFIRRKDEVLNLQENTLKMVVEPQKYTQGTMVRTKHKEGTPGCKI